MTKEGELIQTITGSSFALAMHNKKSVLHPGEYVVMVDPFWNSSAETNKPHKEILIDVYSTHKLEILPVNDYFGLDLLVKVIKHSVMNDKIVAPRTKYLAQMDGYSEVYRVELPYHILDSNFGLVYTRNESDFILREMMTFELFGMDICWPLGARTGEQFMMEIEPGNDFIVILRKNYANCQYSLTYDTHSRELEDEELIQKAVDQKKKAHFGSEQAYYSIYSVE